MEQSQGLAERDGYKPYDANPVIYLLRLKQAIDPVRDKDLLDIKTLRKIVEQEDD